MLESDDGWTSSERMGEVVHMLDTAEHGLDFGTHVGRARGADGGHVGDFIVTYDIRPAFLPDLRPVNLKVRDVPGSTEKLVCMAVQNAGAVDIGTFEMSVQVNGVTLPNARVAAGSLASGGAKDVCVQAALPSSGQRTLAAVADERGLLVEYSETNNVFELAYQATGSSGTPTPGAGATPSALLPDLIVGATGVNGRVPDGKADCKDGPNLVAARVKNAGAVAAHDAIVRLAVDNGAAIERTIDALEAGQERELRFEDVRLTKGEHTLRVLLDPKGTIDEANEHDNARSVTATCQSSM